MCVVCDLEYGPTVKGRNRYYIGPLRAWGRKGEARQSPWVILGTRWFAIELFFGLSSPRMYQGDKAIGVECGPIAVAWLKPWKNAA